MKKLHHLIGMSLLIFAVCDTNAAEKLTVWINSQPISAWRAADFESAEKEAAAQHKPIAWVGSELSLLEGPGKISTNGGRGATLHALYALRGQTILVFEDAPTENHEPWKGSTIRAGVNGKSAFVPVFFLRVSVAHSFPAAVHDAPSNYDTPGKSVPVMDCAGKAPAATALSHARTGRELLGTVVRTKAAWRSASRRSP
jgi:hypothetical protein